MAEDSEGQLPIILDMDSEKTAPISKNRRPSIEQLTAEQERLLLAERAKDDEMQGPSQEELNKQAENREKLRSGLESIVSPYEALFARRASELHAAGESKRIGGVLAPKYEVQDYTLDKNGERQYPFTLRYHVEKNKDGEKEYVPDSYTQRLVPFNNRDFLLDKKNALDKTDLMDRDYYKTHPVKHPKLQVQFENGAISQLAILAPILKSYDVLRGRGFPETMMLPLISGGLSPKPRDLMVNLSTDHPAIVLSGIQGISHKKHGYRNKHKDEKVDQIFEMTSSGTFGPYPTKYKFSGGIEHDNDGKDWNLPSMNKRSTVPASIGSGYKKDDFTVQRFLKLTKEVLSLIPAKNLNENEVPEKDKKKFWNRMRGMTPKQHRS